LSPKRRSRCSTIALPRSVFRLKSPLPHHSTRSPDNPARSLMAGHASVRVEWCVLSDPSSVPESKGVPKPHGTRRLSTVARDRRERPGRRWTSPFTSSWLPCSASRGAGACATAPPVPLFNDNPPCPSSDPDVGSGRLVPRRRWKATRIRVARPTRPRWSSACRDRPFNIRCALVKEVASLLNAMRAVGVIADYALFGAVAQMRYTEAVATLDADVLVAVPGPDRLDVLAPIDDFCRSRGYRRKATRSGLGLAGSVLARLRRTDEIGLGGS